MKIKFGISNIINIIISLVILSFEIYILFLFIFDEIEYNTYFDILVFLVMIIGLMYISLRFAISNIIPKHFKCMRVVKKFLTLKELNNLIEKEIFVPIKLSKKDLTNFKKKEIKYIKKQLLVSNNWVYVNKIMVPKKMILNVKPRNITYKNYGENLEVAKFNLVTNYSFEFGLVSYNIKNLIRCLKNNNIIYNQISDSDKEKYIEDFNDNVKTKDDFIKFIS